MKNVFTVIILIGLCCLSSINAQDTIQKIKIYRTWVSLNSNPYNIKGVLYKVQDSSILVSGSVVKKAYSIDRIEVVKLHINNIETIKIRNKNSFGNGVLIGAISGFVVGGVIGLMDGDDPSGSFMRFSAETKAMMLGVPLAVAGAGIGGLMGFLKVKIPINRSMDNYYKNY